MNTRQNDQFTYANGILVNHQQATSYMVNGVTPLAFVSSPQDISNATNVQKNATGQALQLPGNVVSSIQTMQDELYLQKFHAKETLNGKDIFDHLTENFVQYEIPIGLLDKLIELSEYELNFIIDDSGSMAGKSDVMVSAAHSMLKNVKPYQEVLTRWQEVENRLHILIDMLAYIPFKKWTISFLNATTPNPKDILEINHNGQTFEEFKNQYHQQISQRFNRPPNGGTPILSALENAFKMHGKIKHYLFTDGEPDENIQYINRLVINRKHSLSRPITFMSCTDNKNGQADWMKVLEGKAPHAAEIDDFNSEKQEVLQKQGPYFPYSYGMWLISQLVADINPDDLDAMDELPPFTKKTMNSLLGRRISDKEYQLYFDHHPSAKLYKHLFNEFKREDILTRDIFMFAMAVVSFEGSHKKPNRHKLEKISKDNGDVPVLVKNGSQFFIYGQPHGEWELTSIPRRFNEVLEKVSSKSLHTPHLMKEKWIDTQKEVYFAIAESKGHAKDIPAITVHFQNFQPPTPILQTVESIPSVPSTPPVNPQSCWYANHPASMWTPALQQPPANQQLNEDVPYKPQV